MDLSKRRESRKPRPSKERRLIRIFDTFVCLIIRIVFLIQAVFSIYFLASFYDHFTYLVLIIFILVILVDTVYVSIFRKGKEYTWYSISGVCYTICIVVLIWNLVLTKFYRLNNECFDLENLKNNTKEKRAVESIRQYWLFARIDLCQFLEITVATFILTCCVTRWAFPIKKKLRREALSNLLLSFITNGSDIVEFFGYIDEMDIGLSANLSIAILVFFTFSVFQFSLTLSAKIEPIKKANKTLATKIYEIVLGTEIWALTFVLITQDLPFFVIRLLVLVYYPDLQKNYTLYFFVAKSFILVIFELYYIIVIVVENKQDDSTNDYNDKMDNINVFDDIQLTKF